MRPFIVFGLPRSRTAWLSRFLSYGDWSCGHDELRHARSLDDVRAWFSQPCTGTVETNAAPWWRLIREFAPGARVAVIRRPVAEVTESLMRQGAATYDETALAKTLCHLDRKLDQIEGRVPGVLSVRFADMAREDVCARIFEHCLPYRHDRDHWAKLAPVNIQVDMRAFTRYAQAYLPALTKLAEAAKHHSLMRMNLGRAPAPNGMTIGPESFDAWERDGVALFEQHCVLVGEAPGNWKNKNIPLMRRLYEAGTLQVMTARSNGRMFGYLMTVISPSLEAEHLKVAVHTTFFASPDVPGLGMKLQRAALASLNEQGIDEVFMQAGVRGAGERAGILYKRLGAESAGHIFRLRLAGA